MSRTQWVFQKNIARLREAYGYTLEQVGEAIGVQHGAVSKYEHGHIWPKPDTLDRIADFYGISVADLFTSGAGAGRAAHLEATKANYANWVNEGLENGTLKAVIKIV